MKFSIITCAYNAREGVVDTVNQLKRQVAEGIEVEHVVVDGGSEDGTAAWLADQAQELSRERTAVSDDDTAGADPDTADCGLLTAYTLTWISEPDQGLYDALNKGLNMATGDVIGILHTDDVWESGTLQHVAGCMEQRAESRERHKDDPMLQSPCSKRLDGVYGDLLYVDAEDVAKVKRVWRSGGYDRKKWWNGWMPPHPACFVRRAFAQKVGDYRLDFGSAGDYEWLLRAALVHDATLEYLPQTLVRMRVGGQSNVSTKARLKANASDRRAWQVNGLKPKVWTLWMKPMRKLPQWFRK